MDRRKSLKVLTVGSLSAAVLLEACNGKETKNTETAQKPLVPQAWKGWEDSSGRQSFEEKRDAKLYKETFFTPHERATLGILADIIIPKDEVSGSATDAGVPDFIEFIVKDMPELQTPLRGGLRWLDLHCMNRYNKSFADCNPSQQMELVDQIAWPKKAKPDMQQGVAFFSLMRNLTATGFFTSKVGIADIGYVGNTPNVWDGVPQDVLKQYGLAYDQKTLEECVKKEDHGKLFTFES